MLSHLKILNLPSNFIAAQRNTGIRTDRSFRQPCGSAPVSERLSKAKTQCSKSKRSFPLKKHLLAICYTQFLPVPTMTRLFHFIALVLLLLRASSTNVPAAHHHPWRPPFGLDRVGSESVQTGLEADAEAKPDLRMNPVDLGTILVPHGWLLLGPQQNCSIEAVVLSHSEDMGQAALKTWFESDPAGQALIQTNLAQKVRYRFSLPVKAPSAPLAKDTLHIAVLSNGIERWRKSIPVMRVEERPALPPFGATEVKLRYDLPISVNQGERGKLGTLSFINYTEGWDPRLKDVVVSLPGGGRYVFWRGSSYIPFWATKFNTGLCYEWAETTPPPDGLDCVEPLMDKELRYGRVKIIESTAARVHVRWTYQSTDFRYKVWGDEAAEDYFFYPDGFGTRVLTLKRRPESDYELSEFIILSPPAAYPLDIVPTNAVEMLYFDGEKAVLSFPPGDGGSYNPAKHRRSTPVVYCIRGHKDDPVRAAYFHPSATHYPAAQFGPFRDQGQLVTPAYWGSHWPLSRGKSTGASIDDRIGISPAHNSLLTWAMGNRPPSLSRSEVRTLDSLGRSKEMLVERWAWMIGMSSEGDSALLDRARSFAAPPSLQVKGARIEVEGYAIERRALRLRVLSNDITVTLTPDGVTVNPVFELADALEDLRTVELDGLPLPQSSYAWDGHTLWLRASLHKPASLHLVFR